MSGYDMMMVVKRRLLISHKIEITLTDLETQEIEKELNAQCPEVFDKIEKLSDDELYELVQKIRKKKKIIAGVA